MFILTDLKGFPLLIDTQSITAVRRGAPDIFGPHTEVWLGDGYFEVKESVEKIQRLIQSVGTRRFFSPG